MLRSTTYLPYRATTRLNQIRLLHCSRPTYKKHAAPNTPQNEVEPPSHLAAESKMPHKEQVLFKKEPRQPLKKAPFLSNHNVEKSLYNMALWKRKIGQMCIKIFWIDMDKTRAGSVAGSTYYGECKKQALCYPNEPLLDTAKFYYETLRLPRTFTQWFQITTLHYWLLTVRMRAMPFKYGKNYQQKLVDRFFSDMEMKMSTEMGINSNRIIEGYLKDYHTQMLGAVASYDEALVTDDITLAAALWRNVFNGNPEVDLRHVEALVGYCRSQLYVLDKMCDRDFGFGLFQFVPPHKVVRPLTKAQETELRERVKARFANYTLPSEQSVLSLDE